MPAATLSETLFNYYQRVIEGFYQSFGDVAAFWVYRRISFVHHSPGASLPATRICESQRGEHPPIVLGLPLPVLSIPPISFR